MALKDRLTVLVVDDTYTNRVLVKDALDQIGVLNSTVVKDGEAAIVSLMKKPGHLVISDLHMPGMDGFELLRKLRANERTSKTAFILITASREKSVLQGARAFGANNIIQKPFTTEQLKAAVEAVVGPLG